MSTKVEAVQLSTDPFYFKEFATIDSNIEFTNKWITEGATRV